MITITWHDVAIAIFIIGLLGLIGGTWWMGRPDDDVGSGTSGALGGTILLWIVFVPVTIAGLISMFMF